VERGLYGYGALNMSAARAVALYVNLRGSGIDIDYLIYLTVPHYLCRPDCLADLHGLKGRLT
jgi:hypothetical protein